MSESLISLQRQLEIAKNRLEILQQIHLEATGHLYTFDTNFETDEIDLKRRYAETQ